MFNKLRFRQFISNGTTPLVVTGALKTEPVSLVSITDLVASLLISESGSKGLTKARRPRFISDDYNKITNNTTVSKMRRRIVCVETQNVGIAIALIKLGLK